MKGNSNSAGRNSAVQTTAPRTNGGDGFSLNSTTDAFQARFQQQKKEQDQALSVAELATRNRHKLMVQALTTIRKSLLDLRRIELGERFRLEIAADEWRGWPRIIVVLADSVLRTAEYPKFQVTANDRNEKGTIEIHSGAPATASNPSTINFSVQEETDLTRLPLVLKKSVRNYLDTIAQTILDAEKRLDKELEETALAQKQSADFDERREKKQPELSGDLFEDVLFTKGPFEVLDAVGDVGSLPGLDDGGLSAAKRQQRQPEANTQAPVAPRQMNPAQESRAPKSLTLGEASKLDAVEDLFLSEMLKD
jgi:hypothetical protein